MTKNFVPRPIFMNKLVAPPEWAVDNLVPEIGITCLLGKPGSFKTFGAIGITCCKATGLDFCGRWVGPPCKVLYIAADASAGVELRIQGWIQAHLDTLKEKEIFDEEQPFPNLLLLDEAVNLYLAPEVEQAKKKLTEQGIRAEVLVVDTLFHSSIGADLKLPEQLLPLLQRLEQLMEVVGAKTCVLVHHTTKDGEEFFGTVAFSATVAAITKFDKKDETTASVTCVRMKEGAFFDPFEITLTKHKVKTLPDKRGRTEFEVLVTTASALAVEKATKLDRDLQTMETVMVWQLKNKATFSVWYEATRRYTVEKEAMTGKVLKQGWSEDKFRRKLKALKEQGRVSETDGTQGAEYEILFTERAIRRARASIQLYRWKTVEEPTKKNPQKSTRKLPAESKCGWFARK